MTTITDANAEHKAVVSTTIENVVYAQQHLAIVIVLKSHMDSSANKEVTFA
jgi:hypothetical protein